MSVACLLCEQLTADNGLHADDLYVDDDVVAIQQVAASPDGAVVVMPREHVQSLSALDDGAYQAVWDMVATVQHDMGSSWALSGSMSPCTWADGMGTNHAHVYVVPRTTVE